METIFISIASYRDTLCSKTIHNIFEMARYPSRIYVGICEQNDPKSTKEECPVIEKYASNIRKLKLHYKDAKGPTWARYLCSTLYKNEDFFLQIDSHTLFVKDWDEKCIQMIKSLEKSSTIENKNVLLSHYPPIMDDYEENPKNDQVTHMVECFFNNEGIISFKGAKWKKPGKLPRRNAFIAGGFIFSRGQWVKDVPFDPHLNFLFVGEEMLLSSRSFTNGWDVYTPNQNIVYHAYTRDKEPKFWNDVSYDDSQSKIKLKIILGLDHDIHKLTDKKARDSLKKYGMGEKRSLQDFYDFIGVDIKNKKVGKPKIEFYCPENSNQNTVNILFSTNVVLACAIIFIWLIQIMLSKTKNLKHKSK